MYVNNHVFDKYCSPETLKKIVSYSCVTEMWEHSVKEYGEKNAIVDGKSYSFSELNSEVASFRALLQEKGIKQNDNVGIYCPNSVGFVKAFLAITTMGCCAVLVPPQLPDVAVFGCTMKYNMKALVYDSSLEANLAVLKAKREDFVVIEASTTCANKLDSVIPDTKSPCAIVFTGGTTGKSKGALLSNKALMQGVKNACYGFDYIFEQRYIQLLPMTHVFGLIRTLLSSLYSGSSLWICRNNKDMFKDIAVHKPTVLILVPALAELALNISKQFKKNMLGDDLKVIVAGAAVVPPYLVHEYEKLGITLLPGYGLTESANLVSGNPESSKKPSAVGFVYPEMEVKIVDGELWLKGPNMFDGYVGEPEENAIAFEDGWFKTGDLVKFDDENMLYITGRKKEVIVLSTGENISPAELETKFNELDCIQDSLVYSNIENGKEILALQVFPRAFVLKENGVTDTDSYVRAQLNEVNSKLPSFQRVSKIIIRDKDFIRTPNMKIARGKNEEV